MTDPDFVELPFEVTDQQAIDSNLAIVESRRRELARLHTMLEAVEWQIAETLCDINLAKRVLYELRWKG